MYLVFLTELGSPIEAEASALARDLGITAYEARMKLTAGLPAAVRTTQDRAAATALSDLLLTRRHRALVCDTADVVSSERMIAMRDFRLAEDAATVPDATGPDTRLEYADVMVLLRAVHRESTTTTETVRERKFRPGAAVMTGGLVLSKTTSRDVQTTREAREEVLYAFRRSGATPWLLRESSHYQGLGADLAPTRRANFMTTVRLFRERSRFAAYDERLLTRKQLPHVAGPDGTSDLTAGTDLLAHVLALSLARPGGPYRPAGG